MILSLFSRDNLGIICDHREVKIHKYIYKHVFHLILAISLEKNNLKTMINFTFWIYTVAISALTIIVAASDSANDSGGIVNGGFMSHKMIASPVKDTMSGHRITKRLNRLRLSGKFHITSKRSRITEVQI